MEDRYIRDSIAILTPVLESAIVIAARYCTNSGRNSVTEEDVAYSLRYCARYLCGKHIGSLYPEIYEEDSDDDEEEEDESGSGDQDEEANPFVRYTGDDQLMNEINTCFDTWDDWVPECKAQEMIKNAINKKEEGDGF
jgi:hypothetical protein